MYLLIVLIITLFCLFAVLCLWHYNLVKRSEIKGDKQVLCKTVRIVLICNAVSVLLCLMTGVIHKIDKDLFLLYSSICYILCFPLAIGSYIWMIVKEKLQFKNKTLYLLLSLIFIIVVEFFLYCIGTLMWGMSKF